MVVQVGDKVLVYGAGTPWAFAKKIDPVEVGDKVDVVTLSDGTKLAMPKIELDLSEYVWVVPEFDTPFNIGDVPFQWGMMPLGAAVYSISDLMCHTVVDRNRAFEPGELVGKRLIICSGKNRGIVYPIISNTDSEITIIPSDAGPYTASTWVRYQTWNAARITNLIEDLDDGAIRATYSASGVAGLYYKHTFSNPIVSHFPADNPNCIIRSVRVFIKIKTKNHPYSEDADIALTFKLNPSTTYAIDILSSLSSYWSNFPDYLDITLPETLSYKYFSDLAVQVKWYTGIANEIEIGPFLFNPPPGCSTTGLQIGDKFLIYDPVTKRLVFNDSNKTILASPYWRDITGPGDEITTTQVQYAWDGAGQVYLSQSKTTLSTIFYDDEIQVSNLAAGKTKTIPYHTNDPYTLEGETVSRELVNITGILRAGMNEITLSVRDTTGNKIGFPTPVYIVRSMS